jgi:mono/diheme cytochrome c family protein/glucose/arabinose dehydrogenase
MTPALFRSSLLAVSALLVVALWFATGTDAAQPPAPSATTAQPPPPPGRRVGPSGRVIEAPAGDDPLNADADLSPKPPIVPLSPAEQAKRFWLPPGYRMEPVLSDPVIQEPAQIAFDGNGRMFVLELRGYDQTLDGLDLTPPIGRISVHEDRNDDGVYEHHRVFVDELTFPRFVLPFGANAVLTMESNASEVWKYTDGDGDGVAERKDLFTTGFGRAGNIEHQPSSLFWAMDNWMYSTVNSFRIRWTPTGLLREPTGANGAQWGVTQDNHGTVWFQAGASGMPGYFQFPIHYGAFRVPDQFEPDLNITWGAPILIGDIQAGMPGTRMPDGSLIRATASAGNDIYRGDRLPADLAGHYLYGEVVARIVRRLVPVNTEGLTQLRNAYPLSEFIRSLDPLFRPVDVATAPDGTIYIADMYRGVIEGAPWAKEGTYLRKKIDQYQLDKILSKGRVWRLSYDGIERDRRKPRMLDETPAQLVQHLSHPNGWWRDTAQQLLVLRQDASVVPELQRIVRTSGNPYARFHALWTLEGLGAAGATLVREQMSDPDPRMRVQAIRVSETLFKAGDESFADDYRRLTTDSDTQVVIQAMLTLSLLKVKDLSRTIQAAQTANPARGLQEIGRQILEPPAGLTFASRAGRTGGGGSVPPNLRPTVERGATIYAELCATCHGPDGRGTPVDGAPGAFLGPPLIDSNRVQGHRDYVIKTLLHGMTGPLDGRTYGVMVPMGTNSDEWIADVGSYIRSGFGIAAWSITPADVARVRAETPARKIPWTVEELEQSLPRALIPERTWKASASHNAIGATGAFNFSGWSSGAAQQPGMWFQIELPAPVTLNEIQFDSPGESGGPARSPRAYQLQVSADGRTWSPPVAEGQGAGVTTAINFAPTRTRFVRMIQTGSDTSAPAWFIRNIRLFQAPAPAATVAPQDALASALTFHASFDGGVDAIRAAGDPSLYSAPSFKGRQDAKAGLPDTGEVVIAPGQGRFGDALRFTKRKSPFVFFKGARNIPYRPQEPVPNERRPAIAENWSGTISFWLSVDPARDLEPGFCDPVQITSRAWNDAAFFVEFEKRPESIPFRLGVYSDLQVWNPANRPFAEIPQNEKPLVAVERPPFAGGRWTHVVVTFEHFNTGRSDGVARLYLDGKRQGELTPRAQTFTWEPENVAIGLGLGYVGLLDELSTFGRALTDGEIRELFELERGVPGLLRTRP